MPADKEDKDSLAEAYQALSVFCTRYDPATKETVTDYFSSREIQLIIQNHIGIIIKLQDLYSLLVEMKYNYIMQEEEFMWMVRHEE